MQLAILGTGTVGRTLAARFSELGHDVHLGTRDPVETLARTEPDGAGNPPLADWTAEHPAVTVGTFAEAARSAEVVVNATSGAGTLPALEQAGVAALAGKVLVDVANPLDFSAGFPPTLFVDNTDSLGEQVQRAFPDARVVKTLNTMNAALMVAPDSLGEDSSVFVSGDDPAAKEVVSRLLRELGHTDVIDLGDITSARGTEMFLPLWLRIMSSLGTPSFNVKVVRPGTGDRSHP